MIQKQICLEPGNWDQMTCWVPSNSVIPHRGLTTSEPLGSVDLHWSTESLAEGGNIVGIGETSVCVQGTEKGVGTEGGSDTVLLQFLNLLQGFYFLEIGKRVRMVRKICKLLFGYAWFWQESCGVCSSFFIAGSPDFPQYEEVWLVGISPTYLCGPLRRSSCFRSVGKRAPLCNVSPRSTATFPRLMTSTTLLEPAAMPAPAPASIHLLPPWKGESSSRAWPPNTAYGSLRWSPFASV